MPTKTKKQVKTGFKKEKSDKKAKPKANKAQPKSKPKAAPKPKASVKAKKASRPVVKYKSKAQQERKISVVESEEDRNERLRKLLLQKRKDIVREAKSEIKKFKSGENKQLVETVMDDGDLSVVDLSEDINLKQLSTHREILIKIDSALRKLEEGTYGACEECGDDISEQRLNIMPFAIYCRDCQEKKELMEKIEREE